MDIDEPGWPLIDDFFASLCEGRRAETARRYARVRHRLMSFLDTGDMTLGLGTTEVALLEAERQFHDSGAFWALFGPDELVCCLPSFLHETWLPEGDGEARAQISVVSRLLKSLAGRDLDWTVTRCAYWEAEAAVTEARRVVTRRPNRPEEAAMPDRFLRQPGPEW